MANDRRLEKLLAAYEHAAETLRAAMTLLNNGAPVMFKLPSALRNGNGNGAAWPGKPGPKTSAMRQAARLDAKRADAFRVQDLRHDAARDNGAPTPPKKKRNEPTRVQVRKNRAASAKYLAQFDRTDPKRPSDVKGQARGLGSLVRRGYLAKKGGGYIRTEKPFALDPP